jgi:hypothetical protein
MSISPGQEYSRLPNKISKCSDVATKSPLLWLVFSTNPEPDFFKTFKEPMNRSKKSIPPAYVAWRAGTITLFSPRFLAPHRLFKNSSTVSSLASDLRCREKGFLQPDEE